MSRVATAWSIARRVARIAAGINVPLVRRIVDRLGQAPEADEARRCLVLASLRHDVPKAAPELPVGFDAALGLDCGGNFTWSKTSATITLNEVRGDVGFSLLHELGHYVDIKLIGDGENPASEASNPRLLDWKKIVSKSTNFGMLDAAWSGVSAGSDLDKHFDYLLSLGELFARSYCQWVVTRSGDPALGKQLAQTLLAQYPDQWTDSDFAPIAASFDRLFEDLKWN